MLRPTLSRICIAPEDIENVKNRLAKRPRHPAVALAVQAENHSPHIQPSRYHHTLLRPSPGSARDDSLVVADNSFSDASSSALIISERSSELEEDTLSEHEARVLDHRTANLAALAEARHIVDEIVSNIGFVPQSPPGIVSRQSNLRPPPGHEAFQVFEFAHGSEQQLKVQTEQHENASQGYDGSNDRHRQSLRASDPEYVPNRRGPNLPDEYGLPNILGAVTHPQPNVLLDPMAPTFVPRVRFGSADDHDDHRQASPVNSDHGQQHLRVRHPSSAHLDNIPFGPTPVRMALHPHTRAPLMEGRQPSRGGHRTSGMRPQNRHGRQVTPFLASAGPVMDRYPAMNRQSSIPSDLPSAGSRAHYSGTREVSGMVLSRSPNYNQPRTRAHRQHESESRTPSWAQRHTAVDSRNSSASFSVPNLRNPYSRVPTIHSRHSSLSWNRDAFSGSTPLQADVALNRQYHHREPSYSFYLNVSPLDELDGELRRISATSSARLSSGGSNPMRPFHTNLLSGSLFYSEDLYSEDQQSASDQEQHATQGLPVRQNLGLPPSFPTNYQRYNTNKAPEPVVVSSSGPQSLITLPEMLTHGPPTALYRLSSNSPIPTTTRSPARLSPAAFGLNYHSPISPILPAVSSPSLSTGYIPSDPPVSFPQSYSPLTPRRSPPEDTRRNELRQRRTPGLRIYDDDMPASLQPQTPADLTRYPLPPSEGFRQLATANPRRRTPSPIRSSNRDSVPVDLPRPIFEPTTAELTAIPFLSPTQTARQPRVQPRRRRRNRTISDEQENEFHASAIAGLENERIAWIRRRAENDRLVRNERRTHGDDPVEVFALDETPPGEGRFARLMRESNIIGFRKEEFGLLDRTVSLFRLYHFIH